MLPPVPHSRQSSYTLALPRRASTSYPADAEGSDDSDADDVLMGELDSLAELGESDALDPSAADKDGGDGGGDAQRGLEHTLERMGMGRYQWWLLALCGCGWMADNSALQCVAVILPRVQIHFDLSTRSAGFLSAATMAGMMLGSISWGVLSDLLGRSLPFNATLFLTSVFGIAASFSPSFPVLCLWMFALGSAVGGSMPTDGTLFLENLPHSKQYLLTLLSVFFSLGAVVSSVVSMFALPGKSCVRFDGCDIAGGANDGWRRVLLYLGLVNMCAAAARLLLFRLHESPRFLASSGRTNEAVVALRAIAIFNADERTPAVDIEHADVVDEPCDGPAGVGSTHSAAASRASSERSPLPRSPEAAYESFADGAAVGLRRSGEARRGDAFYTPMSERGEPAWDAGTRSGAPASPLEGRGRSLAGAAPSSPLTRSARPARMRARSASYSARSSTRGGAAGWAGAWAAQIGRLFVPKWRRTVVLMWIIWASMSFAYTMFNVWLPAVLETRAGEGDDAIRRALFDFVLYSVAGCPGSLVGAWMIQTRLGRRRSLALCTAATAAAMFAFVRVRADWAVVASSMAISAAATAMYAVLYGMTPETFGTAIRGTACGTSAALSRLTGICAPVAAGTLLALSPSLPVFASAAIFALTAGCALLLPFERAAGPPGKAGAGLAH